MGDSAVGQAVVSWTWGGEGRLWVVVACTGRKLIASGPHRRAVIREAEARGWDVSDPYARGPLRARPRRIQLMLPLD